MKKTIIISLLIAAIVLQYTNVSAKGKKFIKPNDGKITISGAFFLEKRSDIVILNRFDVKTLKAKDTYMNPQKANAQSGVSIAFSTNSKTITFHFTKREDTKNRAGTFGVFKNGKLIREIKTSKDKPADAVTIINPDGATWANWKLVLPPFYGLNFTGIDLDKNCEYRKTTNTPNKVYVAIGNSITQGTGQKGSYQSYPFLLAQKKNWQLYNLGVGGSKISWPVADMISKKNIDVITILWGYNDWNAGFKADGIIKTNYTKLLEKLLKEHPKTKIYCILPTATKRTSPKKGDEKLEHIRQTQEDIVKSFQQKGYNNLFLINGQALTDISYLRDLVHFNIEGAAKFAAKLDKAINYK